MNKKNLKKIGSILLIILIILGSFFIGRKSGLMTDTSTTTTTITEETVTKRTIQNTLSASGEISSAETEKIALDTTKYFKAMCVEEDDAVSIGENILQYTNGEYLVAPYDCVITAITIPDANAQCTSKHYITVASTKVLQAKIKVNEEKIDAISIGDVAKVTVEAVEKEYDAYVTNISSTASNGYFTVTVEFENDGKILLGMTGDVEI